MKIYLKTYIGRHIDPQMLGLVSLVLLIGILTLHSASGGNLSRTFSQSANIVVALLVMWVIANVPLHYLSRIALPAYIFGLLLLIFVEFFGDVVNLCACFAGSVLSIPNS